jgi:hypothetical protein
MVNLRTKFDIPKQNGLLVTSAEWKGKENIHTAIDFRHYLTISVENCLKQ